MGSGRLVEKQDYFRVVASLPDGREYVEVSFASGTAAEAWMKQHLALTAAGDLMLWIRDDSPRAAESRP
jgi:hypothetical protein